MASTFRRRQQQQRVEADDTSQGRQQQRGTSTGGGPSLLGLKGTKPWSGGIVLTSFGHREVDNLLGGGQPLGIAVWLTQDRGHTQTTLAQCLVQYWCAEGLSQGQHLLVPVAEDDNQDDEASNEKKKSCPPSWFGDGEDENHSSGENIAVSRSVIVDLLRLLPRNINLHPKKPQKLQQDNPSPAHAIDLETLEEGEEEGEEDSAAAEHAGESGLQIAWQYRKSVQQERMGVASVGRSSSSSSSSAEVFCHSYDLSEVWTAGTDRDGDGAARMEAPEKMVQFVPMSFLNGVSRDGLTTQRHDRYRQQIGFRYFVRLYERVKSLLEMSPRKVVRVLLYHPNTWIVSFALPLFLARVRAEVLPVVVLVVGQRTSDDATNTPKSQLLLLQRLCDAVVELENFAYRNEYPPPPEFQSLHGLLKINKIATHGAANAHGGGGHFADWTVTKRPPATIFGLKRDRRNLRIQLLHIPPEDYAQGGGGGSGGVRSGAGAAGGRGGAGQDSASGCSTGKSPLDF